jgi:hypothetical protein
MANGADLKCTFEFRSDELVCYSDSFGRSAEAKIDRAGLTWRTIAVLAEWVRDYDDLVWRPQLEVLGSHLYDLLSPGDVGTQFDESYKAFKRMQSAGRVRLELCFHPEAEGLARLPWEFLYLPGLPGRPGGFFLAGEKSHLVLTRKVPRDFVVTSVDPARRPLRVLVAACRYVPEARSQVEQIKSTISSLGKPGDVDLTSLEDPTFDELSEAVANIRPHVLHVIAHGKPGGLLMKAQVDANAVIASQALGKAPPADEETIDASDVKSMFDTRPPHLVVLHACNGDAPRPVIRDDAPAFTLLFSTAREIAYAGVPAVVAMQYPISVDHALIFVKEFYEALMGGATVSDATKKGRTTLASIRQKSNDRPDSPARIWATRLFGAPVVYIQDDKRLIAEPEQVRASAMDRFAGPLGMARSPAVTARRAEGPGGSRDQTSPSRRQRRCSKCGIGNNPANADCWKCGAPLGTCSYCGHVYDDPQSDECPRCGLPLWLDRNDGGANVGASAGVGAGAGGASIDGASADTADGGDRQISLGTQDPSSAGPPGPTPGILPRSAAG